MDYLGSARVTLSTTAEPLQSSSYHPYGTERTSTGSGARTSYIGREHDKETDLGFGACPEALRGSVRLYEPEYGRFLSTDVLWGKYLPLQPFQYAANNPVMALDDNGKDYDLIIDEQTKTATVKATFYVDEKARDAAKEAAGKINALTEAEVKIDGISYKLAFEVEVVKSDAPALEAYAAKEGYVVATDEYSGQGEHAVNSITTVPDNSKTLRVDAAASLVNGLGEVQVKESHASDVKAMMHEMLHALGGDHTGSGVMAESLKDPLSNMYVNPKMFQQMIDNPLNGPQQRRQIRPLP